ncbi:hypothetical protein HK148_07300, partial [Streptococcus agalactiae]|nr:hypothetical protein [Streptococcus agalactiae]
KEEPKTKLEEVLLNILKNVLDRELSVKDNYFLLGGDSLTATVIIGKIKKQMHIEVSIKDILQQIREDLSHRVIDLSRFPNFDFKVVKISKNSYRIFVGLDNTMLDGWSMFEFLREVKSRYD